jgi:hypothetical protein
MQRDAMEPKYQNWFLKDFSNAAQRVLLLDYGGTLCTAVAAIRSLLSLRRNS